MRAIQPPQCLLDGLAGCTLTSFYSWRLAFMTFHGTPKWKATAIMAIMTTMAIAIRPCPCRLRLPMSGKSATCAGSHDDGLVTMRGMAHEARW